MVSALELSSTANRAVLPQQLFYRWMSLRRSCFEAFAQALHGEFIAVAAG
jgi:hypothetical protein